MVGLLTIANAYAVYFLLFINPIQHDLDGKTKLLLQMAWPITCGVFALIAVLYATVVDIPAGVKASLDGNRGRLFRARLMQDSSFAIMAGVMLAPVLIRTFAKDADKGMESVFSDDEFFSSLMWCVVFLNAPLLLLSSRTFFRDTSWSSSPIFHMFVNVLITLSPAIASGVGLLIMYLVSDGSSKDEDSLMTESDTGSSLDEL